MEPLQWSYQPTTSRFGTAISWQSRSSCHGSWPCCAATLDGDSLILEDAVRQIEPRQKVQQPLVFAGCVYSLAAACVVCGPVRPDRCRRSGDIVPYHHNSLRPGRIVPDLPDLCSGPGSNWRPSPRATAVATPPISIAKRRCTTRRTCRHGRSSTAASRPIRPCRSHLHHRASGCGRTTRIARQTRIGRRAS